VGIRALLALGVVALVLLTAERSSSADEARQSTPRAAAGAIDPQPLYRKLCEPCHGRDGKTPDPSMGFATRKWKHGTSTADITKTITTGVPATAMLPFKGKLTDSEMAAIARYVRSLDPRLKPEKTGGGS
jgi:mono/diheme cytochrome c family protein